MLGEKAATVHSWKKRDKWGSYGPLDQMQLTTAARYCQLIMKEHKEGKDFKEIDLLARQSERHARIGKFNNGGNEADLNPNVENRNRGPANLLKTCSATNRSKAAGDFPQLNVRLSAPLVGSR